MTSAQRPGLPFEAVISPVRFRRRPIARGSGRLDDSALRAPSSSSRISLLPDTSTRPCQHPDDVVVDESKDASEPVHTAR